MKAQADVTDALRRIMGLIQKELEVPVLSTQMLGKLPFVVCFELVAKTYGSRGIYGFTESHVNHP